MNMLSIFIYLAEVVGNIKTAIEVVSVLSVIASIIIITIAAMYSSENLNDEDGIEFRKNVWGKTKKFFYGGIIALFISFFLPGQTTLYMIGASEMSEELLNSETGQKVYTILNEKLDNALEELNVGK